MICQFSIVENKNDLFPNLPANQHVVVFGKHDKACAFCNYEGESELNTDSNGQRPLQSNKPTWILLATDFDTVNAWHGERQKKGYFYYGKCVLK